MIKLFIRVNEIFNCDVNSISRVRENVNGRIALAYFLRIKKGMSNQRTGDILNKSHPTIVHYCKLHTNLYKYDKKYKSQYDSFLDFDFIDCANDFIERKINKILNNSNLSNENIVLILEKIVNENKNKY